MDSLVLLTIAAVLLATIGGFGSLFNLLVSNAIRCYYRMVVYVAFFCLFAVMLVLDRLCRSYLRSFRALLLGYGIMAGLLFVGIWDQTSRCFVLDSKNTKREYLQDRAFVNTIEASLPPCASIFQLPYKSFPESGLGPHKLQDYELFRGYLHSKGLRWSYGAMRNREADLWQASVAQKPVPQMLETLTLAGFSGLFIDRNGFPDSASALEKELASLLATKPLVSENKRMAFYTLLTQEGRIR